MEVTCLIPLVLRIAVIDCSSSVGMGFPVDFMPISALRVQPYKFLISGELLIPQL